MILRVRVDLQKVVEFRAAGQVVVGRQNLEKGEPGPFQLISSSGVDPVRLIVAKSDEKACARRSVLLEAISGSRLKLQNLTRTSVPVGANSSEKIEPGATVIRDLPVEIPFPGGLLTINAESD